MLVAHKYLRRPHECYLPKNKKGIKVSIVFKFTFIGCPEVLLAHMKVPSRTLDFLVYLSGLQYRDYWKGRPMVQGENIMRSGWKEGAKRGEFSNWWANSLIILPSTH
jgi:hypothetical protein